MKSDQKNPNGDMQLIASPQVVSMIVEIYSRLGEMDARLNEAIGARWIPIAEYAESQGITIRTAHDWRKSGRIETRGTARKCEVKVL